MSHWQRGWATFPLLIAQTLSAFDRATTLAGDIGGYFAVRFPNQALLWDGENMVVKNHKEANAFVHRKYREGWTL